MNEKIERLSAKDCIVKCNITIGKEEQEVLLQLNMSQKQQRKKLARYCSFILAFILFTIAVAYCLGVDISVISLTEKTISTLTASIFLLSFLLFILGMTIGKYQRIFIRKRLESEIKNSNISNERNYVFSKEGVTISSEIGQGISYWNAFLNKGEIGHYIYLIRKDHKVILVDKNQLSEKEYTSLDSLLQNINIDDKVNTLAGEDKKEKSFLRKFLLFVTVIMVLVSIGYTGVIVFYPLSPGVRFRLWFARTTPIIIFFILQCLDFAWICVLHGVIKRKENRKTRSVITRILIWIIGIAAILALAVAIMIFAVNSDSEKINSNGTVTVEEPVWLDSTKYYLYQKENFLVLQYLRDADGPDDINPSVTQAEYQKKKYEELETYEKESSNPKGTSEDALISDEQEQKEIDQKEQIEEGYQKIYQTYLKDSTSQYTEGYNAKGNSYVVVYEDEKQVKYIVFDADTDSEQYARYVYYQTTKGADGSWSLMDGKILNMYQYDYQTKEVKDLKKTSW